MGFVKSHEELEVYKKAFKAAMEIYHLSKRFPKEEVYALTDQIRRSSRSVCSNIAEGFRKRLYPASFRAKITDAEAEAAETQSWLSFALACGYLSLEEVKPLQEEYNRILGMLVKMRQGSDSWKV
jgi:four helix bundle protein